MNSPRHKRDSSLNDDELSSTTDYTAATSCGKKESQDSSSFSLQDCLNEFRARRLPHECRTTVDDNDDFVNQNRSNKRNEKLNKPCANGFCYCFTSDSDDVRNLDGSAHSKQKFKHKKLDQSPIDKSRRRSEPTISRKNFKAVSKLNEVDITSSDAPLLHIIQEIHQNCVISEVRINKAKIKGRDGKYIDQAKAQNEISKRKEHGHFSTKPLAQNVTYRRQKEATPISENSQKNISRRSGERKGGRLLEKRLSTHSDVSLKTRRSLGTPPQKPPRSFRSKSLVKDASSHISVSDAYSQTSSIREAERILDDFLKTHGIVFPKSDTTPEKCKQTTKTRKSYPMEKETKARENKKIHELSKYDRPVPSCPSFDELKENSLKIAWNSKQIADMLNYESKNNKHEFKSIRNNAEPQQVQSHQIGWIGSHKLDIDTVDGVEIVQSAANGKNNDFSNLAQNIESKATPVKAELSSETLNKRSGKFILKEQLKSFVSPWNKKKKSPKPSPKLINSYNSANPMSNFKKNFLNSSGKKLKNFVCSKMTSTTQVTQRTIGLQTSTADLASNGTLQKQQFSLQSPPGSYFSNSTATAKTTPTSRDGFNFDRVVSSPKKSKHSHRQLKFSPEKCNRTACGNQNELNNVTYKSYDKDLDRDLTLTKMSDILSGIKARLEASDEWAIRTFRDIEQKDEENGCHIRPFVSRREQSTTADIHLPRNLEEDPVYSEIEDRSIVVAGSPCFEDLTEISHFYVDGDPNAVYAQVNKTPKKVTNTYKAFNSLEQHCPPKFWNVSKSNLSSQSELFHDNFPPMQSIEVLQKVQDTCLNSSYAPLASVETLEEVNNFCYKESDGISYESPNETLLEQGWNQIDESIDMNKSKLYSTKSDTTSIGFDVVDSLECPPSPIDRLSIINSYANATSKASKIKKLNSSIQKYRIIKKQIRKSFRKSRDFIKTEGRKLSNSLLPQAMASDNSIWNESNLGLAMLYNLESRSSVKEQLDHVVNLCRQMPELECTLEMVEAERLLLFSSLKTEAAQQGLNSGVPNECNDVCGSWMRIDAFELSIKSDVTADQFFNYFYIGVFYNGRSIKSTNSAECKNGRVFFRDSNILFDCKDHSVKINCDLYMLRLRKVTTLALGDEVKTVNGELSSMDELMSRFRLHGSFSMSLGSFTPYRLKANCNRNDAKTTFCLHTSTDCLLPVTRLWRNTNIGDEVKIHVQSEIVFPCFGLDGFLNVQDVQLKHNWNRRWCAINGFNLEIWDSPQDVQVKYAPIISVDLTTVATYTAEVAERSACARPRSFALHFLLEDETDYKTIFLAADNQTELESWVNGLNAIFEFMLKWMK